MSGKATIELIGRLARDPEMRFTSQGKAVVTFSIPVQERKDGETTWYKVSAWEKQAEVLNQYATKGTWLWLRGVPTIETWQDKNTGETRCQFAVTLREFTFCGGGESNSSGSGESYDEIEKKQQAQTQRNVPQVIENDSDLPF